VEGVQQQPGVTQLEPELRIPVVPVNQILLLNHNLRRNGGLKKRFSKGCPPEILKLGGYD
jgi:hypothetical protein